MDVNVFPSQNAFISMFISTKEITQIGCIDQNLSYNGIYKYIRKKKWEFVRGGHSTLEIQ